jgi:hypothetical protein
VNIVGICTEMVELNAAIGSVRGQGINLLLA